MRLIWRMWRAWLMPNRGRNRENRGIAIISLWCKKENRCIVTNLPNAHKTWTTITSESLEWSKLQFFFCALCNRKCLKMYYLHSENSSFYFHGHRLWTMVLGRWRGLSTTWSSNLFCSVKCRENKFRDSAMQPKTQ